eukprot:jgi/Galph1/4564/GphlegSOOS_G3223.1
MGDNKKNKKVYVGPSRIFWPKNQEDIDQVQKHTVKGRRIVKITPDMMEAILKEQTKLNHPLLTDSGVVMDPLMPTSYALVSFSIASVVVSTISWTIQTIHKRFFKSGKKIIFVVPIRIRVMILHLYFLLFLEVNASFMDILFFDIGHRHLYLFFMFNLLKFYTSLPYFTIPLLTFLNVYFVVRRKVLLLNIFRFHIMNTLLIGLLHTLIMQLYLRLPEQIVYENPGKTIGLVLYIFMMSLLGRCFWAAIRGKYTEIRFISTAVRKYITDQARGILRQWEEQKRAIRYQQLKDKEKKDIEDNKKNNK